MDKKQAKRKPAKKSTRPTRVQRPGTSGDVPRCGLCGATDNLTKTECCGNWICDDEENYVLFSYAHNSCHRNHSRYTLCSVHFQEGHPGRWQDCQKCRKNYETEMYAYYGTNEYNFETLENPPEYQPTKCAKCGAVIVLGDGGYSFGSDGYKCFKCSRTEFAKARR